MLTGCIEPQLVECADGRACAPGQVCDLIHVTCVGLDQLAACNGLVDGTDCAWDGGAGRCFDGVCLPIGCGNHALEPGEQCDDGNRVSLDGCSAECTSTETCGNGIVDVAFQEQCDDGNLRSRDGCDSRCQTESVGWQVIGVRPTSGGRGYGAFDEARGRLVHLANDGLTWEWNGTAWLLAATTVPQTVWSHALVYDSDRQRVVLVGTQDGVGIAVIDLVWDWDGAAWQPRATTGVAGRPGVATYDRVNRRIVNFADGQMSVLDAASNWTMASAPGSPSDASIAYDGRTQTIILVIAGYLTSVDPYVYSPPRTWQLSNTTWTEKTQATSVPDYLFAAPELIWDQARGALFSFGGSAQGPPPNQFQAVYPGLARRWQDPDWQDEPIGTGMPRARFELAYDSTNSRLIAFGGSGGLEPDDVFVLGTTAAVWTKVADPTPKKAIFALAAFDTRRGHLVLVQSNNSSTAETWLWDGTWQKIATTTAPPISNANLVYDPIRDRVVLLENNGTWTFDGTDWTLLGSGVGGAPFFTLFDPSRGQLFAVAGDGEYVLGSTDLAWAPISAATSPALDATTAAFDARNNRVIALDRNNGRAYAFVNGDWLPTLSPSTPGYSAIADERRGSVLFVHSTSNLWEHAGDQWSEQSPPPIAMIGQPLYDPLAGRLLVLGTTSGSRVMVARRLQSALSDEMCAAGVDADGDGKFSCDDDDCWWTCTPGCLPFVSCP